MSLSKEDDAVLTEGTKKTIIVNAYERNPKAQSVGISIGTVSALLVISIS
jgi:predicted HNH restriction endonuclease